jgi:hypothetical protein
MSPPNPRAACKIVAPSATVTCCPGINGQRNFAHEGVAPPFSNSSGQRFIALKTAAGRGLPQPAQRGVCHRPAHIFANGAHRQTAAPPPPTVPGSQTDAACPTDMGSTCRTTRAQRSAPAAAQNIAQIALVVEDHDCAGAKRQPGGAQPLKGDRRVELGRGGEGARRAAHQQRLQVHRQPRRPPGSRSDGARWRQSRFHRDPGARHRRRRRSALARSIRRCRDVERHPARESRYRAPAPASRRC